MKLTLELTYDDLFLLEMAVDEVLWKLDENSSKYQQYHRLDELLYSQRKSFEVNRDFYKDKASKMFGIPYDEVTDEQRTEAKKQYMYGRSGNYSFKDCLITAKLLEPQDSNNSLKRIHNKFRRNSEVD